MSRSRATRSCLVILLTASHWCIDLTLGLAEVGICATYCITPFRLKFRTVYEMPKALALIAHNLEGIYSVVFDTVVRVSIAEALSSAA